ncbi:MAG: ATP-binding protein [Simkaniaceae bacterium]|nr:ATP-binding protein [Candidatus Sacchlamyda saccharinae]
MKPRKIYQEFARRIKEPRKFMQVLLGPRQVGKTTLALYLEDHLLLPTHYNSADIATLADLPWIEMQWETARQLTKKNGAALLIIDEIQKIPNWSSLVKKLWDEDTKNRVDLKVVILGSSPWLVQKGLSESLAGRFEILHITHWSLQEMHEFFQWNLEKFIYFGGYPGPATLSRDLPRWLNYINDSLIETTISRDILLMTQVNKPVLLRRLFQLGCTYSSQILSYQKMLGQLQDVGNTTTLANYLDLLSGAGLLTGIHKFANQQARSKGSSPKFQVLNTALMSAQSGKTFEEAQTDREFWGRLVESAVGAHLLNSAKGTQIEIFYWREKNEEVDFVLKKGKKLVAIEVKSGMKKEYLSGLNSFKTAYDPIRTLLVGNHGEPIDTFLQTPIEDWFN